MNRMKKGLTVLLTLALLFSHIPGSVMALSEQPTAEISQNEGVAADNQSGDELVGEEESSDEGVSEDISEPEPNTEVSESEQTVGAPEEIQEESKVPQGVKKTGEGEKEGVADELQARIDALPSVEKWNELCEAENEEFERVNAEVTSLCKAIKDTYGLDLEGDDFDPTGDYSAQCPLNLTKLIAILYPGLMTLENEQQAKTLPTDDAFDQMCRDIFGVDSGTISSDTNYAEVYVGLNSGGEQTGTIGTQEKPYGSLNSAYNGVAGKSGVIIHLMENYKDVTEGIETWPITSVPAIIISDAYDLAFLNMSGNSWSFTTNTGFYNVKVKLSYGDGINSTMYANGNTLVFGGYQKNNFAFINESSNRYYPTLFGASGITSGTSSAHSQVEKTNLKIYGGTWSQIFGGGEDYSDVTGTAALTIDGSYVSEDNQIQSGAVAFDNTHLAYMEGSSNIYGGGAGEFTMLSSVAQSNVNNSMVKLSYITTDKYVTPCGGWMGESAEIILDHVSANGVNARSEGQVADRVVLTIKNSSIKDRVGSLGGNQGAVNKKYITSRNINDFNITIEDSTVQKVAVKSGELCESNYDNFVTGVDLIIKNSTVSSLAMAELPANYQEGTVNLIHLENSQINTISCYANFAETKEIVFKQIGTKEKPFSWTAGKFGGHYTTSNSVSEKLVIEDSYVDFKIPYKTDDLSILGNSEVKVNSDLTLTVGSYAGNLTSKLIMSDGSSMKISGLVTGTGTTVDPVLNKENSKVQIIWKRTADTGGLDFFKKTEGNDCHEKKDYVPALYTCQWYNYDLENTGRYIYVDGQNGHDDANEYADPECNEAVLGYSPNFPVKTLGKAYDMCQNEWIVLCGPYDVPVTEAGETVLINRSQKKDYNVTITSTDDIFDYTDQAYIKFTGTGTAGRADIKEELTFDNIRLISDLPSESKMRIFSNGNKTVYNAGVTAEKTNAGRIELYGGAYNEGVPSTDITVNALNVNLVTAGGYGNNAFVGDSNNKDINHTVVAKLHVKLTKTYSNILEVTFSGDAYGSVEQILDFDKDTLTNLYLYLSPNYKTIYGDFKTHVSGDKSNGNKYAYITPPSQTVKGTVEFSDDGSQYGYLDLREGTYDEVNIKVGASIEYSNLFVEKTNANNVSWKLSGNVGAVYGNNSNTYLASKAMKLNVELDSTGNTIIKAGKKEDTDPAVTGYSKNSNVRVLLKNFDTSGIINSLQGFGSVTFDNCQCTVNTDLYTTDLSVVNNSKINFMQTVTVGQEAMSGSLSLLQNGFMIVNNRLSVWGNMVGDEVRASAGGLENNWANALDETELIVINGTASGYVYYTTSYDSASIKVTGNTKGTEYIVPDAEAGTPPMTISCVPEESEGEKQNRIWNITNPVSKKVIFVDGTMSTDESSYSSHDGSTPALAFATLEEAYNSVLNNGTIVICGDTSVSSWPKTPKAVTITSKVTIGTGENAITHDYFSGGTSAYFTIESNVELNGDTTFEYLNIKNNSVITIGGCGNKLVMGHPGDDQSLIMTNKAINVCGGTLTTINTSGINADVTIYAGTYGSASGTNSSGNTGNESYYKRVKIRIYGGVFDNIYIKGNLYDRFHTLTSDPELYVENAEVKTAIHAAECNYTVGSRQYKITIGKNMVFSDDAKIVTGTNRANYAEAMSVSLNVDGSGGEPYKIPVISTGKSQNAANIRESSSVISIKNASIGKFYGGLGSNSSLSATEISTELSLYENTTVDNLYFGGANSAGKSTIVNVWSDTVVINSMSAGSENYSNEVPVTAELNFINLGKTSTYKLQSGISLNGLTKVKVTDSNIDLTGVGPRIAVGTLDASKGNLTYLKSILILEGDYIGGTADSPTVFYGCKAPNYTINGTVSGITQLQSVDPDPSSDGEVTGKFYYGILVKASHNVLHSNSDFQCLQNNAEGNLVFSNMEYQPGDSENMDQWMKADEEDNTDRIRIFVSGEEGSDSNTGTYVSPVKTIKQAYLYADELYTADNEKTKLDIVLLDDVTFDGNMPTNLSSGYIVTIRSDNTTNKLILNKAFNVPVDTTFDNICIESTLPTNSVEIFACGHKLICSDKLEVKAVKGHYPILYGGNSDSTKLDATHMEIYGGTWNQIFGGSKISKVDVADLILGGNVDTLNIGSVDESFTGVFGGGLSGETGTVQLTVNGGSYYRIFGGGLNSSAMTNQITVDFKYGTTSRLYGGGQYADVQEDIQVNIGSSSADKPAFITGVYRGSGLYAGLAAGKKALTNVYGNAEISENAQFAAGGYSGNLDTTELHIYGGVINCNVYAGGWGEGTEGTYGTVRTRSTVEVRGGIINGSIYGGGNLAVVNNDAQTAVAEVKILGGTITGNIYGGGNAAGVNSSQVEISSDVEGDIFGGSQNIVSDTLQVQKSSNIILNACTITGSVFGGSDTSGLVSDAVNVTAKGNVTIDGQDNGIYGGGSKAALKITPVVTVMSDVQVTGNIYGGGKGEVNGLLGRAANLFASVASLFSTEVSYNISGLTDANVPATNVTINGNVVGNVYGGGEMATVGNSDSTTWNNTVTNVTLADGASVTGNIYGGGKGQNDKDYAVVYGCTNVKLNGGTVKVEDDKEDKRTAGAVFGGGEIAPIAGNTNVEVKNGKFSNVFGGNDVEGEVNGETRITLPLGSTAEVAHIYGGGREATHKNTNKLVVNAGTVTEVYGGGYGAGAQSSSTDVVIAGGTINSAYGGGNAAPTTDAKVTITGGDVTTAYAGGNAATVTQNAEVVVKTADATQHVDTIYAGNNKAMMSIKPTLTLTKGKIGTVYCGGNAGVMDVSGGLTYDFDYPDIEVGTVYAGCNNIVTENGDQAKTSNVTLNLISGNYGTVYGGNNANGYMENTNVIVNASTESGEKLTVDTVYGGGNHASSKNTTVTVTNGTVDTVYGGGNAASVTEKDNIILNDTTDGESTNITNLYCGNNAEPMALQPEISLTSGKITNFYGGGNKGVMTHENGITYTFDSENLTIDTIYGGGNEAGVDQDVTLNIVKGNYTTIYGGSNSDGNVETSTVNIQGNVGSEVSAGKIFGGGRGKNTSVTETHVNLQNGIIYGNVYGGSGFGTVESSHVLAEENANGKVVVLGSVYGAGFGESSTVTTTDVMINLNLKITSKEQEPNAHIRVTEELTYLDDSIPNSGESNATAMFINGYTLEDISYINGNVFGGGDMGKVGDGYINSATNTAAAYKEGSSNVTVTSGYINGNVFGGGNGAPSGTDENGQNITDYTLYMGTVFGTAKAVVTGGYINGNVFGCGQQSRTYAVSDQDTAADGRIDASYVTISTDNTSPILIGGSIFGGGNKGEGNTQNASVATVYGDTHVSIKGVKGQYTQIYLLSNKDDHIGGGVYGDGNLCIVNGKKFVDMTDFSCGFGTGNIIKLKTFYSLQRADVVNLTRSRIVPNGAVDLVAEDADQTLFSINRVGQLNLKESSTMKLVKTVNLLSELTSDQNTDDQFINKGNNNGNYKITGNSYTGHGGTPPSQPLTEDKVSQYVDAYEKYIGSNDGSSGSTDYPSINVVCVANGGYLEIKKTSTEYGGVKGLFTLQLLNAIPGEGGGFVYADITDSTGNFVCVTEGENAESQSGLDKYMYVYHDVGGEYTNGKYEYYLWYLKGGKYQYDVNLVGYIGTLDTSFEKKVSVPVDTGHKFVLAQLTQNTATETGDSEYVNMLKNTWDEDADKDGGNFAIELVMLTSVRSENTTDTVETPVGYIGYKTVDGKPEGTVDTTGSNRTWGIWREDAGSWSFIEQKAIDENTKSFYIKSADKLCEIGTDNIVGVQFKYVMHKGKEMTTEFRDLPFSIQFAEVNDTDWNANVNKTGDTNGIQLDSCISLTMDLKVSAIKIVPTQSSFISSGRLYAGVSASSDVKITENSSFTAQFITKYVPGAYNTSTEQAIEAKLVTKYDRTYLYSIEEKDDEQYAIGYTIKTPTENGKCTLLAVSNAADTDVSHYTITKNESGYCVRYNKDTQDKICYESNRISSGFTLPAGTMITLLASLDDETPSYWYYYCTSETDCVSLKDFCKMNTGWQNQSHDDHANKELYSVNSTQTKENLIFIFDFSQCKDGWSNGNVVIKEGQVMLEHLYKGTNADIMDYMLTETTGVNETAQYTHESPKPTNKFEFGQGDGIDKFDAERKDTAEIFQNDVIEFTLKVKPDKNVSNTQFDEREYAVLLTLRRKDGTEDISFPEGTTFSYKGEMISPGPGNKFVVIPIKEAGAHDVVINTSLYGFEIPENAESQDYELIAKLYSTSATGYYNSIEITEESKKMDFTVIKNPVYALKVTEEYTEGSRNHLIQYGQSFEFEVTAKGGVDADPIEVDLYQYEGENGQEYYQTVDLGTVFTEKPKITQSANTWKPNLCPNAPDGVYRLEFSFHNRKEYWDFIVMP